MAPCQGWRNRGKFLKAVIFQVTRGQVGEWLKPSVC